METTLRQLETFVAIARHGSTLAAASQTDRSQSAASMALAELEKRLGASLFDRIGKRLALNENGRLFLPKVLALLDQAQELERMFASKAAALRIGASMTVGAYVLPRLIATHRRRSPESTLHVDVANTRDVVEAVAQLKVDLGLIEGQFHHPDITGHPWLHDELVIVAAPTHPLAKKRVTHTMLAEADWILREPGSGTRELVENLLLPSIGKFNIALELSNPEAIKHLVADGVGIACMSQRVVADLLHAGRLVRIRADLPPLMRRFSIIVHRQKHVSAGMQAFLDVCSTAQDEDAPRRRKALP